MPIILVQSEKTAGGAFDHYEDITGKTYQFPNQYKNLIVSGEQFIYYRGLRKRDGTRRKHWCNTCNKSVDFFLATFYSFDK